LASVSKPIGCIDIKLWKTFYSIINILYLGKKLWPAKKSKGISWSKGDNVDVSLVNKKNNSKKAPRLCRGEGDNLELSTTSCSKKSFEKPFASISCTDFKVRIFFI